MEQTSPASHLKGIPSLDTIYVHFLRLQNLQVEAKDNQQFLVDFVKIAVDTNQIKSFMFQNHTSVKKERIAKPIS